MDDIPTPPSSNSTGIADAEENALKRKLARILDAPRFTSFITALIVLNAITIGLETSPAIMAEWGPYLLFLDNVILAIFVVEVLARLYVEGRKFWSDGWNLFDFFVVTVALIPETGPFSILRAFRIIRVLRIISNIPSLRRVIEGLFRALPGMGSITFLLCLITYVSAVMTTVLFGEKFPQWFGNVGKSAYSLFQIMTLEGWSDGIVRPVMEVHPWAWAFFVPFILITAFAVLNLFVGIIVDGMQQGHAEELEEAAERTENDLEMILKEVRELRADVRKMREK